jgi:hypothetical protein
MAFLTVLAQTASLYMMAAVVLPEVVDDAGVDLAVYYERHSRWFFGFFLATLCISVIKDVVISGRLPGATNLGFHLALAVACVSALAVRKRRYHEVLGIVCAGVMAVYIGLFFTRLR